MQSPPTPITLLFAPPPPRASAGTPVQNNLGELHALMEFAVPGLLGSAKDFKTGFEKPINAGQDRCGITVHPC